MINDVAKDIIEAFNSEIFIETGFFRASTAVIIRSWFPKLPIFEVEINPEFYRYGVNLFENDENITIVNSESKEFLKNNINMFKEYSNPVFYLDAHWDPNNWPLRGEVEYISTLPSPIILIDDFKTPGPDGMPSPNHGYDSYNGHDCGKEYIEDLIKPVTDCIYYARKPNIDGQGSGIIFVNREYEEIKNIISDLDLIVEKL
tara:strand:+ start:4674 stop:5279 length:606 start_codon:yes stop_codon:yes gene_type:complete